MALITKNFKTEDELIAHIKTHTPSFYHSSKTSTVVPYDKISEFIKSDLYWCDLSHLPSKMELKSNGNLVVSGPVSWKEAREFLIPKGRNIMTAPTEELALITAGAATSATGERCFAYGNLRSQIQSITYLNFNGEPITLSKEKDLSGLDLTEYQASFAPYREFKNAPFPRLEKEIDLMIGTEGQLGVITQIEIATCETTPLIHLFILVPKWEDDDRAHLEILEKIQSYRKWVNLCEHIDHNSFDYLEEEQRPNQGKDAIFLEIHAEHFDAFYENFLATLSHTSEDQIFELTESRFHQIRASVPRAVFETNSKMGVTKMGTDIQVKVKDFKTLLDYYRELTKLPVRYNLFGHFGDCHLHFNYMPSPSDMDACKEQFEKLYTKVRVLNASPFAEHGIGILKQKYIGQFWQPVQYEVFKQLKSIHDPHNQFFPQGYMNMEPRDG